MAIANPSHFTPTHGHRGIRASPTYNVWRGIIQRCTNPRAANYRWYGAKGVTVCERWRRFEAFLADMGTRPDPHPTLGPFECDRFETDMEYGPGNCRWLPKLINIARANNPTPHDAQGLPICTPTVACPF